MPRLHLLICAFLAFAALPALSAETTLQAGDLFPATTLENQHGKPTTINNQTQRVLFTADMGGGKVVRALLDEHQNAAELLVATNAVYLSDVSGMPSLIRKMMALPAMRKRPYPIMLDIEGDVTALLPRQAEAVTLIELNRSKIMGVKYITSPNQLRKALILTSAKPQ